MSFRPVCEEESSQALAASVRKKLKHVIRISYIVQYHHFLKGTDKMKSKRVLIGDTDNIFNSAFTANTIDGS